MDNLVTEFDGIWTFFRYAKENWEKFGFLFAANVVVWGGIFFYVVSLHKRSQSLKRDLELLKEIVDKDTNK